MNDWEKRLHYKLFVLAQANCRTIVKADTGGQNVVSTIYENF